jgi:hypothetical protein
MRNNWCFFVPGKKQLGTLDEKRCGVFVMGTKQLRSHEKHTVFSFFFSGQESKHWVLFLDKTQPHIPRVYFLTFLQE